MIRRALWALCILVGAIYLLTAWRFGVSYVRGLVIARVSNGAIGMSWYHPRLAPLLNRHLYPGFHVLDDARWPSSPGFPHPTWHVNWSPRLGHNSDCGTLTVPLWIPLVLLLAPAAALQFRHSRRTRANHCRHCRYNLSNLPPNSPCPECGRAPSSVAKRRQSVATGVSRWWRPRIRKSPAGATEARAPHASDPSQNADDPRGP